MAIIQVNQDASDPFVSSAYLTVQRDSQTGAAITYELTINTMERGVYYEAHARHVDLYDSTTGEKVLASVYVDGIDDAVTYTHQQEDEEIHVVWLTRTQATASPLASFALPQPAAAQPA